MTRALETSWTKCRRVLATLRWILASRARARSRPFDPGVVLARAWLAALSEACALLNVFTISYAVFCLKKKSTSKTDTATPRPLFQGSRHRSPKAAVRLGRFPALTGPEPIAGREVIGGNGGE